MDENEEGRRKWEEEGVIGHIVPSASVQRGQKEVWLVSERQVPPGKSSRLGRREGRRWRQPRGAASTGKTFTFDPHCLLV